MTCVRPASNQLNEEEKLNYWSNKLNPSAQYAQVSLHVIIQQVISWMCFVKVMKAKSVSEMVTRAAEQFAEWPCLGYRLVNNGLPEDKFSW